MATNANGNSTPASVTVNWVAPATSPPVCTVSSSNSQPTVGSNITLTASCTNGPTSYEWAGCTGTGATCATTASATGAVTYYVSGINQFGKGPPAGVVVAWTAAGGGPPGGGGGNFCGQFSSVKNISIDWGDTKRYKTTEFGSFGADTVYVVSITVPSSPASYGTPGNMAWAEYNGPPTLRHLTLSKSACDFRDPDPTGNNGPFAAEAGTAPFIGWNVGAPPASLVPGQTYYFNIRNLNCGGACEASTSVNWPH